MKAPSSQFPRGRCGFLLGAVVLFLAPFGSLRADDKTKVAEEGAAPDTSWMEGVTLQPRGRGNAPEIRPCRLDYKLSWRKLVSAGNATIEIEKSSPGVLTGVADAKSSGLARALYSYDCDLNTRVAADSLKPLGFEHSEVEKDVTTSYETEFGKGFVRTWTTEPNEKGVVERKRRTYYYGEALDLLSTILYVRSMPLETGDTITRVVQPFNAPYLVSFHVDGREQRKFDGEEIPTIRMSITIQKVNKDLSLKHYDKMKEGAIWVSDDDFRLPIEIRADIFIGYITCMLESRQFTDGKEAGTEAVKSADGSKPNQAETAIDKQAEKGRTTMGDHLKAIGSKFRGRGDKAGE